MTDETERLYEQLLILRCQTGDPGAFRELVERYGPRLTYYVRKICSRRDSVDDLVQDVWLDVMRQLPRLQVANSFVPWLYRIARGHAMLAIRRRERLPISIEELDPVDGIDEPTFTPDDIEAIHVLLDELEPTQREVLVLKYLEELSYEEIGEVIGCPTGTVRSRLHYAKRELRRLVDQYHER